MTSLYKALGAAIVFSLNTQAAGAFEPVRPIEGYKCFRVNVPEEKRFDPKASPPVFEAPTEGSRQIGLAASTVFVKWPLDDVDGFVEIIWGQKGVKAWIRKNILRPWHIVPNTAGPAGECVPTLMSNGYIGIGNALPYKHH